MTPLCEVTKHEVTGKPCPGDGLVTVAMLYRSGVSEQKRVCPHHATQIEASNAQIEAERRERFGQRAAESDARAGFLDGVEPTPTLGAAKAVRPFDHEGRKPFRSCRWGDCPKLGRVPLCNMHTARVKQMRVDGDAPLDFDAATAPHDSFEVLWSERQRRIAAAMNKTPTVAELAATATAEQPPPELPTAGEPGEPPTPPTEVDSVRAWAERAEAALAAVEAERDDLLRRLTNADRSQRGLGEEAATLRCRQDLARVLGLRADDPALTEPWIELLGRVSALEGERNRAVECAARAAEPTAGDGSRRRDDRVLVERWELCVLKYVAGQMLDDLQAAANYDRPPSPTTVRSLRAIVEGRAPEAGR